MKRKSIFYVVMVAVIILAIASTLFIIMPSKERYGRPLCAASLQNPPSLEKPLLIYQQSTKCSYERNTTNELVQIGVFNTLNKTVDCSLNIYYKNVDGSLNAAEAKKFINFKNTTLTTNASKAVGWNLDVPHENPIEERLILKTFIVEVICDSDNIEPYDLVLTKEFNITI